MAKKLDNYNPSTTLVSGLTPKGELDIPLMEAHDIVVDENNTRLDEKLESLSEEITEKGNELSKEISNITINGVGIASSERLGAVKVGSGLTITEDGVLGVDNSISYTININEMVKEIIDPKGFHENISYEFQCPDWDDVKNHLGFKKGLYIAHLSYADGAIRNNYTAPIYIDFDENNYVQTRWMYAIFNENFVFSLYITDRYVSLKLRSRTVEDDTVELDIYDPQLRLYRIQGEDDDSSSGSASSPGADSPGSGGDSSSETMSSYDKVLLSPFYAENGSYRGIATSGDTADSEGYYPTIVDVTLPDIDKYHYEITGLDFVLSHTFEVTDNGKLTIQFTASQANVAMDYTVLYTRTPLTIVERFEKIEEDISNNSNTDSGSNSSTDDGWIEGSCKDEWYKSVYPSEVVISMSYPDEYEDRFYNIDNVHLKLITDYSGDQPIYYGHAIRTYRGSPPSVAEGLLGISFNPSEDDGKRVIYRFSGYRVCGSGYECGECNETFEEFINNTNANYPILDCITMHKYKL